MLTCVLAELILQKLVYITDSPSRTAWDDDEDSTPTKHNSWDLPTPSDISDRAGDSAFRSERSNRSKR